MNLLFNLKLSQLNYFKKYIEKSEADLIITFIDNNLIFYKLKKFFSLKKFIAIQNGLFRMAYGDIFGRLKKVKDKDLSADMIFTFNKNIGKSTIKELNQNVWLLDLLKIIL